MDRRGRRARRGVHWMCFLTWSVISASVATAACAAADDTGLLFYLSGEKGTTADFSAGGTPRTQLRLRGHAHSRRRERRGAALRRPPAALLVGAGQHLRAARHALVLLALALSGRPDASFRSSASASATTRAGTWSGCASTTTATASTPS